MTGPQKLQIHWAAILLLSKYRKISNCGILRTAALTRITGCRLQTAALLQKTSPTALAGLDPANKDYYLNNLAAYQQHLAKEDEEIKNKLAGLPQKKFVTFHEAWFYFAQAYGLEVAEAFEPFPGKEPTPEFLAHFIDVIKKNNIKVVFVEPQFSPESIQQVANDLHLKIRTLDPEGGGTA